MRLQFQQEGRLVDHKNALNGKTLEPPLSLAEYAERERYQEK
jgi:hypothetical protein